MRFVHLFMFCAMRQLRLTFVEVPPQGGLPLATAAYYSAV
jgi:hypothetical protein